MGPLTHNTKHIKIVRKMKKNEYMAPEMEVVELKSKVVLLAGSGEEGPGGEGLDD